MWVEFETQAELEFEFLLTKELGFGTVARMRREMPQEEFVRWGVYYGRVAQRRQLASMRVR